MLPGTASDWVKVKLSMHSQRRALIPSEALLPCSRAVRIVRERVRVPRDSAKQRVENAKSAERRRGGSTCPCKLGDSEAQEKSLRDSQNTLILRRSPSMI